MRVVYKDGSFYLSDDKRMKAIDSGVDLLDAVPNVDDFAKAITLPDIVDEFNEWIGSIRNREARQRAYEHEKSLCYELARLQAKRNGIYRQKRGRKASDHQHS